MKTVAVKPSRARIGETVVYEIAIAVVESQDEAFSRRRGAFTIPPDGILQAEAAIALAMQAGHLPRKHVGSHGKAARVPLRRHFGNLVVGKDGYHRRLKRG